jgi:hypothetical protein
MPKLLELTDPKVKDQIKDYIMLMLGAPVVKIELDDNHLALAVNRTCEMMQTSHKTAKWDDSFKLMVAQDGALALAKLMLGRIRSKFGLIDIKGVKSKSKSTAVSFTPMDGQQLLEEGEKQYQSWQNKVFGKINEKACQTQN